MSSEYSCLVQVMNFAIRCSETNSYDGEDENCEASWYADPPVIRHASSEEAMAEDLERDGWLVLRERRGWSLICPNCRKREGL
ncbi:hypothetical protein PBI_SEBATA_43 [Mycobacterium phage Sebata]|uniref:Uncharacterized protein n=7 Tax=Bixzunavirus TaxID=680114 RepID=A0A411CCK3_9CAUD|nr:hypothetical protein DANDELION_46 [Mycobacterium phage Dandelion]YP_009014637.1 hypothetical protein LINSTU_43 [Mycobacterium phage LinStu]YP_009016506.1 hypothetical protein NAPPY_44 [Mycobacterium phage Nappy]YP_009608728.1 hypothetical protein FDI20_gp043 [Mycobacterium phage Sebata]YP_010056996.1 hypothetical protein KHO58_gp048 [Mycobacterium phage Bigswole]YP_010057684.1 hypothetical protein KHO61_gp044 [Mycobacterium phage Mangeria]YP_010057915.1 hypothetical protein KHO62_gp041 [My